MGFAEGFAVGFEATSKLMESTFKAMEKRRLTEDADKQMAEAAARQQEIDATFMQRRMEAQASIEQKLETGELTDLEALHESIRVGSALDTQRDLETGNLWGGLISSNASNPILVDAAAARWSTDMERAKGRDARKGEAIRQRVQLMERELSETGATSRTLAAQGVNPFEEGTEYFSRYEQNEDFAKDAKSIELALQYHGGNKSGLAQILAAANPDAAGESLNTLAPGTTIEQFMDTAAVMRGMLQEGPDGMRRALKLAQQQQAKVRQAKEEKAAEEEAAKPTPTPRERGAAARKAFEGAGGPSTKAQPSAGAMEQLDWWKGYFTGEAKAEAAGG